MLETFISRLFEELLPALPLWDPDFHYKEVREGQAACKGNTHPRWVNGAGGPQLHMAEMAEA